MQYELRELQQRLGITFVFVTHDQEEALAMSDEIFVLNNGNIVQSGTPVDIYDEPINHYVADFIGESNILNGTMIKDCLVEFAGKRFECVDEGMRENEPVEVVLRPGTTIGLYFDPEDIHVMRFNESEEDFDARLESYED